MTRPVALLTMATGYVGPSLARCLVRDGYDIVLHGFPGNFGAGEIPIDELADDLRAQGAEVATIDDVDLTTSEGNQAVVAAALDRFGRLDSACFVTGSIVIGRFLDMDGSHWDKVKRANLDMVFHALGATIPAMTDNGGQIVVFTSATGARPEPGVSLYGATRAGANALVRAVGLEHAADGISINAVGTNYMDFPGFIAATGAEDPERRKLIEAQVPAKRFGTMEELAEFTTVLLNGKNRFQTGQFFSFSGGWST